jgi:hypothetical protein
MDAHYSLKDGWSWFEAFEQAYARATELVLLFTGSTREQVALAAARNQTSWNNFKKATKKLDIKLNHLAACSEKTFSGPELFSHWAQECLCAGLIKSCSELDKRLKLWNSLRASIEGEYPREVTTEGTQLLMDFRFSYGE